MRIEMGNGMPIQCTQRTSETKFPSSRTPGKISALWFALPACVAALFATSGAGATNHLGWEILMRQAGVSLIHVPFKGLGVAMPDVLGGRVTTMMSGFAPIQSSIKAGQLRSLAVTSRARFAQLPEVPTVAESGLPGYENMAWFAIFAPAGTPPAIVARLNAEIRNFLATGEAKEAYQKVGQEPAPSSVEELAATVKSYREKYERVVREANIRLE